MPSLFELILGSAAKHNDLLRELGAKAMELPAHDIYSPCPTAADLASMKRIGVYDPELRCFVPDGPDCVKDHPLQRPDPAAKAD